MTTERLNCVFCEAPVTGAVKVVYPALFLRFPCTENPERDNPYEGYAPICGGCFRQRRFVSIGDAISSERYAEIRARCDEHARMSRDAARYHQMRKRNEKWNREFPKMLDGEFAAARRRLFNSISRQAAAAKREVKRMTQAALRVIG